MGRPRAVSCALLFWASAGTPALASAAQDRFPRSVLEIAIQARDDLVCALSGIRDADPDSLGSPQDQMWEIIMADAGYRLADAEGMESWLVIDEPNIESLGCDRGDL